MRIYHLIEREDAYEEALARIGAVKDSTQRADLKRALDRLRTALKGNMDLRDLGWPPKGSSGDDEDLLYADTQKSVSAVIRFVHADQEAHLLKYILKVRT